ncbi:MAG: HPr-rel-A system PqqD family peptide chaperone [Gammaproteobacteria bacterium]
MAGIAATDAAATLWRLNLESPLVMQRWGEAVFLFQPESGQTHFLNQSSLDVLNVLATRDASGDDAYRQVCAKYSIDEDQEFHDAVVRIIELLDALGIIRAAS